MAPLAPSPSGFTPHWQPAVVHCGKPCRIEPKFLTSNHQQEPDQYLAYCDECKQAWAFYPEHIQGMSMKYVSPPAPDPAKVAVEEVNQAFTLPRQQ